MERTKKRAHLWKKAIAQFLLCFVMGFFTGFFPTGDKNSSSNLAAHYDHLASSSTYNPEEIETFRGPQNHSSDTREHKETLQRSKLSEGEDEKKEEEEKEAILEPRKLVIIVTPINEREEFRGAFLRRLGDTMSLVPKPLLWIVIERETESNEVNEVLRKTRVMYRHLTFSENFTDVEAEIDHQRNVALKHIEKHRLSGIVHFAGLSIVHDLDFFEELRKIEAFGAWPMALLSANRQRVTIEGPVCDSSQVIGWHLKKMNNDTEIDSKPPIHISSFGFNSSILWDPERWGRTSSVESTSQSSMTFVKQAVLEDETEIKGVPLDGCSKITLWRLQFPFLKKLIHQSQATPVQLS